MGISLPWSYSKLSLYKKCPAAFKFRYIDKKYSTPGPAAQRGTEIHSKIENFIKWHGSDDAQINIADIGIDMTCSQFLNDLRYEYMYGLQGVDENNPKMWSECIDTELELRVDENWNILDNDDKTYWAKFIFDIVRYTEKEIRCDGIIKREANPANMSAEIIDIKTGKMYDNHRDQAIVYALAYYRVTGFNPKVTFLYVDQGKSTDYVFSNEDLDKEELAVRNLLADIDNDPTFEPCVSYMCNYCDCRKSGLCL